MKLVIVESPSKSKTIQKYLGNDFKVMASGGHVCDLPEKSLGIDLDDNYNPEYVVNSNKKDTIRKLKSETKKSKEVYLATDPDREGEAISWHLSKVLELDSPKRIEFNEISRKAVDKALNSPRQINQRLVDSQQARRILDRLVGYKISPVLSRKIKSGLSGGRVQSAALKMIVDREREIKAFKPQEYWNIFAMLNRKKRTTAYKATLNSYNGKKIKVTSTAEAKAIENNLKGAQWFVDGIKKGVSKSRPSPPFTTSTLQQDASIRLRMSSSEVMRTAQQLYEGVNIESQGQIALVTYIRTDSMRVSQDAQREAIDFIKNTFGNDYAPARPNIYVRKSNKKVQDAHEAIRPISLDLNPEDLKDKIGRNLYRLYKLIYDRFLASQMTDAVYNTLNIDIKAQSNSGDYGFKLSGRTLVFKGYTAVYDNATQETEDNIKLPNFTDNEQLDFRELISEQKFTKPPARFTEAALIKSMEENGIGRPSTYASIISVLARRYYTAREKRTLKPTVLGETVVEFMEKNFANIVDIKFTAELEDKLDEIEQGQEWQKVIADFYPPFEESVQKAYTQEKQKIEYEVSDVKCDKCGAMMVVKTSRYGKFLACPNFPRCKNIKNIIDKVGTCPKCGGDIGRRRTKRGKIFYGCSNYPSCDFMSWDIPAPYYCPKCKSIMKVISKNGNKIYVCINRDCRYSVNAGNEEKD